MSEWDFLWGLDGQELVDAMSSGGTQEDWKFVEEQERIERKNKWEELKRLRDDGKISNNEFKSRKEQLFK